ncbi:3-isopropylmalate dehydratase [candidate division MSBL1 archaeon SCGC-AAA261O19]|uniref:3-isopropylmalate dehydratase small subunit n=2 Tax=candidate division MSBL1 TaxID=215777 RepID=A0A133UYM6_9EURY|nr:3-isopropylmalate dehydratase [candidate division MSBL1 archaeon SCGC-AAA261C02]KXB04613.1 3-isopropylmalate dehydratase [candidate division MSBL1 archaeon SCGC-AAA261O19]
MKKIKGKVWKFDDDISTDLIISGKYKFKTLDMGELSKHAMEGADPDFAENVGKGDIIVAGENFGCGSSREQAPLVLKELGVGAIISKFFARIFYRNAINVGIPVIENEEIPDKTSAGDQLEVDLTAGTVENLTTGEKFEVKPLPEFLLKIIEKGGLVEQYKKQGKLPWE